MHCHFLKIHLFCGLLSIISLLGLYISKIPKFAILSQKHIIFKYTDFNCTIHFFLMDKIIYFLFLPFWKMLNDISQSQKLETFIYLFIYLSGTMDTNQFIINTFIILLLSCFFVRPLSQVIVYMEHVHRLLLNASHVYFSPLVWGICLRVYRVQ